MSYRTLLRLFIYFLRIFRMVRFYNIQEILYTRYGQLYQPLVSCWCRATNRSYILITYWLVRVVLYTIKVLVFMEMGVSYQRLVSCRCRRTNRIDIFDISVDFWRSLHNCRLFCKQILDLGFSGGLDEKKRDSWNRPRRRNESEKWQIIMNAIVQYLVKYFLNQPQCYWIGPKVN